ncbi:AC transposable element-derived protein 4 [Fusarium oxysporum f. sp. phaseoli]
MPIFPAEEAAGHSSIPFNIEYRDFHISPLSQEPLEFFQLFVPISLIQPWIEYTNSWVAHLIENSIIDNWNTRISKHSKILQWEGISTATTYVRLGVMIYLGVHRDTSIKNRWHSPSLGVQRPLI